MITVGTVPGSTGTTATASATAASAAAAASSGPNSPALATNRAATLVDSFMSYMSPSSRKLSQQQPQSPQLFSSGASTGTGSGSGAAKQAADVAVTSPPGTRGSVGGLSQVCYSTVLNQLVCQILCASYCQSTSSRIARYVPVCRARAKSARLRC
jgi:hypothetical protein